MTLTADPTGTSAPADRFVRTTRHRIHYVEAGAGHPVVLLHGGGPGASGASNFAPNIAPLAEHFRVLAPDMPGWGESDTSTAGGRDHPAVLVELLDALGIDRAAVVGNSVGGMTAISTAVAHPDRVSHLVTMGAPAPTRLLLAPADGPTEGMKALTAAYRHPNRETIARFVDIMCFDPAFATDELVGSRLAAALAHPEHLDGWNSARTGAGAVSPYFQLGDQVATITAPTMVIQGRDDRTVHFENSLFLTARIADSRLVMFNRCGHWAQLEHAAEFNRTVASFVGASFVGVVGGVTMRTFEFRIYSLASAEAVEAYRTIYYPKHRVSLRELFGVAVHGFWSGADGFQFYVLMSYPEGADTDLLRRQYREHPAAAANMPGFDPAVIKDVSVTLLEPAAGSPLQ